MQKKISKFFKIFTSLLAFLAVVLAVLLVGVRLFGLKVYTVLSPSMEPEYPTGSIIYVKEVDTKDLRVNDVITFKLTGDTTATHRIVEIIHGESDSSELYFKTKGDANDIADASPVSEEDVIGKPVFKINYLGYLASYIQQPPIKYFSITIGLILIIIVFTVDYLTNDKKGNDNNIPSGEEKEF